MPANHDSFIDIIEQDSVLQLVFNRPERKNAFSQSMYMTLADELLRAADCSDIRVVLLRGAECSFSSGNDLEDFMRLSPEEAYHSLIRFMNALYEFPKPVVAAVQGPAVGIGTTMLLHCDLVYADPSAQLKLPFVSLGLCPEFASSDLLPRLMGHVNASELLLLGESISAEKAQKLGLVNEVLADDALLPFALAQCAKLAQQPPGALRITKQLMKEKLASQGKDAMQREMTMFAQCLLSAEFKEAVTAFFEKRKPDFSNVS